MAAILLQPPPALLSSRTVRNTCRGGVKRSTSVGIWKWRNLSKLKLSLSGNYSHERLTVVEYSCRASAEAESSGIVETVEMEQIVPAVIIGAGRVGLALEKMGMGRDIVLKRGQKIPVDSSGPIIVCTRNDDLDEVVDSVPLHRREDLVFIQNGMLETWLEARGLLRATQVLVFFAVAKAGDSPIDGKTDLNPEGLTVASGKWASAIASRLHSAGLSCKVLDREEFIKPQLEKLIWICSFNLVGTRHQALVGTVEQSYSHEVVELIGELVATASTVKGITFDTGVESRLCAYARSVGHFPTAVKEFKWRNGWFYDISRKAIGSGTDDPCPLHTSWLKEVGAI